MYKDNNSSVIFLLKLMEKKIQLAPYLIDQVKGTFDLRESSTQNLIIDHTEGMYDAMIALM